MNEISKNNKSEDLKEIIEDNSNANLLRLHKEAIRVERERSVKYVLNHFLNIDILDEAEYQRYLNIFLHDLDS